MAVAVKLTGLPTVGRLGLEAKSAMSDCTPMLNVWVTVVVVGVGVLESVTVRVALADPVVEKECATDDPVAVPPSLKLQLNKYGEMPPVTVAVRVTGFPAVGELGLVAKFAVSAWAPTVRL